MPIKRLLTLSLTLALAFTAIRAETLADLPSYRPDQKVSGTIRSFGFSLGGMMPIWEERFPKYQTQSNFEDRLRRGDAAIAGRVSDVADLGPQGRELVLTENLAFYETFHYSPT